MSCKTSVDICSKNSVTEFSVFQGDLLPKLKLKLFSELNIPVDLTLQTNVTIIVDKLDMTLQGVEYVSTTALYSGTVTNAIYGEVEYNWMPGNTDFTGRYRIRIAVTFPDVLLPLTGRVETFPKLGSIILRVR